MNEADQRPVAQPGEAVCRDVVKQHPGFLWAEHRGLALADDVLRAADGGGGVMTQNLAGDEPVEQHPHGRQVLLDPTWTVVEGLGSIVLGQAVELIGDVGRGFGGGGMA